MRLAYRAVLVNSGEAERDAYCPLSGIVSLITSVEGGAGVETPIVGREGMLSISAYLGLELDQQLAIIQFGGEAVRIPLAALRERAHDEGVLRTLFERYGASMLVQASQSAACNRLHPVGRRLARWLLLAHDRTEGDVLPMTHDFLAQMLGVRRASVTTSTEVLQRAGLVRFVRGEVEIVDRPGLEAAACDCYPVMVQAIDQVFASRLAGTTVSNLFPDASSLRGRDPAWLAVEYRSEVGMLG